MDESRLALQITLSGFSVPKGQNLGDFLCHPYLTNKQGVSLGQSALQEVRQAQPGQPYELVYIYYQNVDAAQNDHLDFNLDLTLGPCGPWWNFDHVYTGPGSTPTPPPLIGNYHLAFSLPVNKGVTIQTGQEVTSSQGTMRLEAVTFTPSYTMAELCFRQPASTGGEWAPEEVTMQVNGADPIPADHSFAVQGAEAGTQDGTCLEYGFGETVQPGSSLTINVKNLQSFDGLDALLRSADLQQTVAAGLAKEGIVIDFGSAQGSQYWQVVKKPAGMTIRRWRSGYGTS